jgi:hypothetical protein
MEEHFQKKEGCQHPEERLHTALQILLRQQGLITLFDGSLV